jgi:hypothetical protein|tara:strand:+ start:275 stop:487 length:213 start_codon:yes stop_codon:yes gene_type:complete
MDKEKLSRLYSFSANEIQKLTIELYEELHDDKGDPIQEWEPMLNNVRKYKRLVIQELEAIKVALREYAQE